MSSRVLRRLGEKLVGGPSAPAGLVRKASGGGAGGPPAPFLPFPPGPRQFQQLANWAASAGVFGATGFGLLCYFSDWRVVVNWIPFYNLKFKDEEIEAAKK